MPDAQALDNCLKSMAAVLERNQKTYQLMIDSHYPPNMLKQMHEMVQEGERAMSELVGLRLKVM